MIYMPLVAVDDEYIDLSKNKDLKITDMVE